VACRDSRGTVAPKCLRRRHDRGTPRDVHRILTVERLGRAVMAAEDAGGGVVWCSERVEAKDAGTPVLNVVLAASEPGQKELVYPAAAR